MPELRRLLASVDPTRPDEISAAANRPLIAVGRNLGEYHTRADGVLRPG